LRCYVLLQNKIFDMKTSIFNTIFIEEHEDPDKGLPDGIFITVKLKTILENLVTSYSIPISFPSSKPCLFEGCYGFSTFSYIPRIKLRHDSTWDGIGRAYYSSCDYQFTEFHFALCSVDELSRLIEAKMRQYERNRDVMAPCVVEGERHHSPLDFYFAENRWNEDLSAWIEDFQARHTISKEPWVADDHYSCRPFNDKQFYLHQLALQVLSGHSPHVSAAKRPCCRSFLMASCRQLSGDDLLGHG